MHIASHRPIAAVAALALSAIALAACLNVDKAAAGTTVLGATGAAEAGCPQHCLVEARVTGFQTSIGRRRDPFVTPARGRIVAWSIKLGMPRRRDIKGFNRKFGESKARISILKRVRSKRRAGRPRPTYRLLRESPVVRLRALFGKLTTITLPRPLKVGRGQVVALTIPTWAPTFSVLDSKRSRWLASRSATRRRGGCVTADGFANLHAGGPDQKLGSSRVFGCAYHGARLLYSARFVKRGTRP
ncbi:MAG: hypothetical protein WB771_02185 [Solirubrobacterales bacterium]